jgi:hypothetical protein
VFEERVNKVRSSGYIGHLDVDASSQFFCRQQRTSHHAITLGVTPDKTVRVKIRGVNRLKVKTKGAFVFAAIYIFMYHKLGLVPRQAIKSQLKRPAVTLHHLSQQFDLLPPVSG